MGCTGAYPTTHLHLYRASFLLQNCTRHVLSYHVFVDASEYVQNKNLSV